MKLQLKKRQWIKPQWEEPVIGAEYTEPGSDTGAKASADELPEGDVRRIHQASHDIDRGSFWPWLQEHKNEWSSTTLLCNTDSEDELLKHSGRHLTMIYCHRKLNLIHPLNPYLARLNEILDDGGYLMVHARTAAVKRELIYGKYPGILGKMVYYSHYFWHRMCPRMKLTRWLYFALSQGRNRTYHRVEVLGRLYRAGFEVIEEGFRYGEFFVLARKFRAPITDDTPTEGPVIKLNRIGKDGEIIGVYKFRTMYPYSEYLQPYMLEYEGLMEGGKFAHDYRVNGWGRFMRKTWIDELPMLFNVLKGQMKLVGVRPLSRHYFSLYTPEMQALRVKVKPGLLPPFYYEDESPKTVQDVQDSERRYIESYLAAPFRTDWRYFWGTVKNIIFKKKRSH